MRQRQATKSATEWFQRNRPHYEALVGHGKQIVHSLLSDASIAFVDVQGRCKSFQSFEEKFKRKSYPNGAQGMTDLAGLRVIVLVESDIKRVRGILERTFKIHRDDSLDKSDDLGTDRLGYRSLHLICDLGDARHALPEFARFSDCVFEIQIRTALQHAWAEIEHDRGYKLKGELPSHLKRKFSLLSGLLEIADAQFSELTQQIDAYRNEVAERATAGDLAIELNSSSIKELCTLRFGEGFEDDSLPDKSWQELLSELRSFGITNLTQLDALLGEDVLQSIRQVTPKTNSFGLLRDAMMLNNIGKYFAHCWKSHWHGIDEPSVQMLRAKCGEQLVDKILREYNLDVRDLEDFLPDQE